MKRASAIIVSILILGLAAGAAEASPRYRGGSDNSIQFKLGGFFLEGDGEFWRETQDTFFLDADDFRDPVLGFSFVSGFGNHLELGLNVDFYDTTVPSDYREFTDEDGFAIIHDTSLRMMPLSVDLRLLPTGRYAGAGQARRPVFYVGGGLGVNLFEYEEVGDFIDFSLPEPEVVFDQFRDSGASFQTHVLAGVELPMSPEWGILFEGKYTWTDEELGSDFAGLGELDLGGLTVYVGAALHF